MAHLRSVADCMHVPTPEIVVDRLRQMLAIPDGCYCFDPCCGTGEALATLAPNAKTYGVELELDRAMEAKGRLSAVLPCPVQDTHVANGAFGLILLNPPYSDSTDGRLEQVFIRKTVPSLQPGGILVLIVKITQLRTLEATLRRHFDIVGHWKFPDDWYQGPELAFTQTVLVARRRAGVCVDRHPQEFWAKDLNLTGWSGEQAAANVANNLEPLPDTWDDEPIKVPVGIEPRPFVSTMLLPEELLALLANSPVPRVMLVPSEIGCGRPPLPLKQGHIALTLASGLVNGVYGTGRQLHIAKGTIVRQITKKFREDEPTDDGRVVVVKQTTDTFSVKIRALTAAGKIYDMVGGPAGQEEGDEAEAEVIRIEGSQP